MTNGPLRLTRHHTSFLELTLQGPLRYPDTVCDALQRQARFVEFRRLGDQFRGGESGMKWLAVFADQSHDCCSRDAELLSNDLARDAFAVPGEEGRDLLFTELSFGADGSSSGSTSWPRTGVLDAFEQLLEFGQRLLGMSGSGETAKYLC
jgi:hypothetical protein